MFLQPRFRSSEPRGGSSEPGGLGDCCRFRHGTAEAQGGDGNCSECLVEVGQSEAGGAGPGWTPEPSPSVRMMLCCSLLRSPSSAE